MPATKGTLVHAALERLFALPPEQRTREAAGSCLDEAGARIRTDPDFTGLALDEAAEAAFFADAAVLLDNYFDLEDPTTINPIGLELMLEVPIAGVAPPRHHRPPRARRRRRAGGHRLQDRARPVRAPGAAPPRRGAVLRLPVRAALRQAPGPGAAAVPPRPGGHHRRAHRAVTAGAAHQGRGHLAGHREGLRGRRLPAPPRPAVQLVRLQALLPGTRRRPGHRAVAAVDPPVDPAVPVATPVAVAVTVGSPAA